ncbi:hypothetical protein DPMN_041305 [Dreissena polymorpha]|uniref:Uncharacterized protein n=1 Tax=Dreissena polymorpha TaxID=45954 RepID=A0A9D4CYU0_DREPO|nr:hypothetical protein DPMN_041305 [Dreissena polymorpha]
MKELEELEREMQDSHTTRREVQSLQSMRTWVRKMRKVRGGISLAGPGTTAATGLTPAKTTSSEVTFGGLGAGTSSTDGLDLAFIDERSIEDNEETQTTNQSGHSRVDRSGHHQLTTLESRDTDTDSISADNVTHDDMADVNNMADADMR